MDSTLVKLPRRCHEIEESFAQSKTRDVSVRFSSFILKGQYVLIASNKSQSHFNRDVQSNCAIQFRDVINLIFFLFKLPKYHYTTQFLIKKGDNNPQYGSPNPSQLQCQRPKVNNAIFSALLHCSYLKLTWQNF